MTAQPRYSLPAAPAPLAGLVDLALDLRWSWSHSADALWAKLAPDLWEVTGNPWHILQTISRTRLEEAAADPAFLALVEHHVSARHEALKARTWFEDKYAATSLGTIAYFSMEFGLSEALPIYSGGLGILAGDFLKAASDLGVPIVGVGLLWQQGYFRQALSTTGEQIEFFPFNDPGQLPISPLRDAEGEWVEVTVPFPRRDVRLRVWEVRAGRVGLYLLDANHLMNNPADRGITSELYGGGSETRLQQEMILGIGGWRVLRSLGIAPEICHLNEGHAALAVLERARCHMEDRGVDFALALTATRPGNLFTTHTPVEAGFDSFAPALVAEYLGGYADSLGIGLEALLALGRPPETSQSDPFNMAYLAIRGSGAVNGVSRLHGEVSRGLFQRLFPRWPHAEVPIGHVTNGVHVPSWDSEEADALWTRVCGKHRWLGSLEHLSDPIRQISDEDLWAFRDVNRRQLIATAREHVKRQGPIAGSLEGLSSDVTCLCDPGVLTLGFARRFATYKRPDLLLYDPDRLRRLLCGEESKVQLVLAGKAHPADTAGKEMIRRWTEFIGQCDVRPHIMFLVDYDMGIAEHLVHGVDVWINTPRRPWEASGTSGMKVLVNGGLNLSELDGWWAEAYAPDVGWALGDGLEHGSDPAWDAAEAVRLYDLLENEIIPEFYDRDEQGIPHRWMTRVRESMARLAPRFSTNRMMEDYLERYYLPGVKAYRERAAADATGAPAGAAGIEAWRARLDEHWAGIGFGEFTIEANAGPDGPAGPVHSFRLEVSLGSMPPDAVRVELYAEALHDGGPERHLFTADPQKPAKKPGSTGSRIYRAVAPATRPAADYTPRVVPEHAYARVPLEAGHILWYR
jgi:starch phosphorylase